jgi:mannitol/fructose-specific phosphotransferase system IIA component (Ntr-type)
MKLASLLNPDLVCCEVECKTRDEVVALLVKKITSKIDTVSVDDVNSALAERERLSSTIVSPGVAFPHARVEGVGDLYIGIATSSTGFDFDGEKVNFVALFIIGGSSTNIYLKTMAGMARLLSGVGMQDKIVACKRSEDLIDLVKETQIEVEPTVRASDIMEPVSRALLPDQPVKTAADLFVETGCSILPVTDPDGKYVGLLPSLNLLKMGLPKYLSEMDNLAFIQNYEPFEDLLKRENEVSVQSVMDTDAKTYMVHTPIIQVAIGLVHDGAMLAPILEEDGRLAGVISAADFITRVIRA